MATRRINQVLRHLRKAALLAVPAAQSDGHLLRRFLDRRDEMAFETLVERHRPMVLGGLPPGAGQCP